MKRILLLFLLASFAVGQTKLHCMPVHRCVVVGGGDSRGAIETRNPTLMKRCADCMQPVRWVGKNSVRGVLPSRSDYFGEEGDSRMSKVGIPLSSCYPPSRRHSVTKPNLRQVTAQVNLCNRAPAICFDSG